MKNFSISRLAETILVQRKQLGLTQQELAAKAGINRSMLCRLENQDYVPSLDQLTRLANTLQFDVADVFIEYKPPVFHRVVPRNIAVYGGSTYGLSVATLLARHHHVILYSDDPFFVEMVNTHICPVRDDLLEKHFVKADLNLKAVMNAEVAFTSCEFAVIAVSSGYHSGSDIFDTSVVDTAISVITQVNPDAVILIRSTVPVGYTSSALKRFSTENLLFSPDFSHKSTMFYDHLYPDRIVIGCDQSMRDNAEILSDILKNSTLKKDVEVLRTGLTEAETIKLFYDTFRSLRVSCFNELDSFAESKGLNTMEIVHGVSGTSRTDSSDTNPSFGASRFSLPGNINQLMAAYNVHPVILQETILKLNRARSEHIAAQVIKMTELNSGSCIWSQEKEKKAVIGVFRLSMDTDPDFPDQNPVREIIERIKAKGATIIIYEPDLEDDTTFLGNKIVNDLRKFKKQSCLIIANRYHSCLDDVMNKVYSRDFSYLA